MQPMDAWVLQSHCPHHKPKFTSIEPGVVFFLHGFRHFWRATRVLASKQCLVLGVKATERGKKQLGWTLKQVCAFFSWLKELVYFYRQCFDDLKCIFWLNHLIRGFSYLSGSVLPLSHLKIPRAPQSLTQMELVGNWRLDNRRGSTAAGMQTLWWISQICRPLSSHLINLGCCSKEGANLPPCVSTRCQSSGLQ